jgi:hypothetical protein
MAAHAKLSPSAAKRWLTCPASVKESATAVSSETEYSKAGTAAHEALHALLTGGAVAVGSTMSNGVVLTPDLFAHAEAGLAWVEKYRAEHGAVTVMAEERVQIGSPFFQLDPQVLWGTADIIVMAPDELVIADLKTGHTPVEVESNEQLMLYAVGAMEELGWMWPQVRLVIIQPKVAGITEWVVSKGALMAWAEGLKPRIAAALSPTPPYVPSEDGCRYCPAAGVCKALQAQAIEIAKQEFDTVDALIDHITPDELGMLLSKAGIIETAIATAREHAAKLISLGTEVPGWKLVEGRKNRKWIDGVEVRVQAHLRNLGYNEEEFAPRKLVSPSQAEKLVGKGSLDAFIDKPVGAPTLAPVSDKRPALAVSQFESIPDISGLLE